MTRRCKESFFAQAAVLPPLRQKRHAEPPQPDSGQRSRPGRRAAHARPTRLLLRPRSTRRLRAHGGPLFRRGAAAAQCPGAHPGATAVRSSGRRRTESGRRIAAYALRRGDVLSAAAAIAPPARSGAGVPAWGASSPRQRAIRSAPANRGALPADFSSGV